MNRLIRAEEACTLLGVSRPTLYSYVSRGLLQALPGPDHRTHLYRRSEVERLARQAQRRKPRNAARDALDFGLPVLESKLTLIQDGQLYFGGEPAVTLAGYAGLEEVADRLWQVAGHRREDWSRRPPPTGPLLRQALASMRDAEPIERALALFALPMAASAAEDPVALLRRMAACLLGREPSMRPIHRQCALAWNLEADAAALLRGALVLCADHELNASSFAARVVASTGASLQEAVRGGLAALSGPRHGLATREVERLLDEVEAGVPAQACVQQRLQCAPAVPGFGHPLYPAGDPRAAWILERLPPPVPGAPLLDAAARLLAEQPSLDFALVALRRALGLPAGAGFVIFALGRCVGWLAHAMEQRPQGLIRPRARYAGGLPRTASADSSKCDGNPER